MYKIYKGEEEDVQNWMNEREQEGYVFIGLTNIANRGVFDIVVIMQKKDA